MPLALEIDPTVLNSPSFVLLLAEWFAAMVAFSSMAAAPNAGAGPHQFVVFNGVMVWLVSLYLACLYVFSQRESQKSGILNLPLPVWLKAELAYYGLFAFFSFVSFLCAAVNNPDNSSNIKASAAFSFFLMLFLGCSTALSQRENAAQSEGPGATFIGVNA